MEKLKLIKKIKKVIEDTKFESKTFIVGGFVRDSLMNNLSNDFDLDITVKDNGIDGGINLAKHLLEKLDNASSLCVFENFGTAQLIVDGIEVEVVACRKETYNANDRKPEVIESTLEEDVFRRDFTVNSLLFDISNSKLIDLANGKQDIENKIIRATSDPMHIFFEDPLRIMRAIRFAARLGFSIEDNTFDGIIANVSNLKNISNERIRDEFSKILVNENVVEGLELLKNTGILEFIIPEFKDLMLIKNQGINHVKNAWTHTLQVVEKAPTIVEHRLAALMHDIGKGTTQTISKDGNIHFFGHEVVSSKITKKFMKKFKFTNSQIELVTTAIKMHMNFNDNLLPKTIRKMIDRVGIETFEFALDLAEADSFSKDRINVIKDIKQFILDGNHIVAVNPVLPINGNDLIKVFNLKPSKLFGEVLGFVKDELFENPEVSKDEMLVKVATTFNLELL